MAAERAGRVTVHQAESMNDLWIRWNSVGTHAEVRTATEKEAPPAGSHLVRPRESYYGIPHAHWAVHDGEVVDVLHLQFAEMKEREGGPPLAITAAGDDDAWYQERFVASAAPVGTEFGFHTGSRMVPCTRARLISQCVRAPETPRVWTPEVRELVPPEDVPFLVDALREHRRAAAERSLSLAGGAIALGGFSAWQSSARSGWAILGGLAAAWLAAAAAQYRRARATGPRDFAAAREEFRHDAWVRAQRPIYTEFLLLLLILVAFAETFGWRDAIEAAGLVKPAVREGEYWRLLTGSLLHGGVLHLVMNGLALWSLGPLVEAHSRRGFLPLLFLVSALFGSGLSMLLLPHTTSVGASGGILGLAGCLLVLGYRRRRFLPAGYVERLGVGILATALFGIVGYAWVDNAMHFGGLLGGAAMSLVFEERRSAAPRATNGKGLSAGNFAMIVLVLGAVMAVGAIYARLSAPPGVAGP